MEHKTIVNAPILLNKAVHTFVISDRFLKIDPMKRSIPFSAIAFLVLVNLSCSQSVNEPITNSEVVEVSESDGNHQTFKPTKNMVAIDGLRGNFTVKVGQQVYYAARVHGSVGYSAEVYSEGSGLDHTATFTEYDQKQEEGMTGGDAATEYFIFDALEVGTYTVIAKRYFRGDLEEDYTITVNIE